MNAMPVTASGERTTRPRSVPEPEHREGEQQQQGEAARARRARLLWIRQPTIRPLTRQHGERQSGAPRARRQVAEQVRGAGVGSERKRSTIPSLRSVAIEVAGPDDAEGERLHEDAADQVLAVAAAGDVDRAAEDVREQQHEHQRLQRDVEQLLGDLADVLEVAPGEHEAVRDRASGWRRSCGARSRLARSVSVRKTSSSVASRRWTSTASTPAASSARTISISRVPARDRHGDAARRSASAAAAPSANGASAAAARASVGRPRRR